MLQQFRLGRMALLAVLTIGIVGTGCVSTTTTNKPGAESAKNSSDTAAENRDRSDPVPTSGEETDLRRRARLRVELAATYYQSGKINVALEELRQSLEIDPSYPAAYGMLGLVYMDLNDQPRAEESFQRGLKLAPEDSELNNNYGWYLCQTGRAKESFNYFSTALKNPLYLTPSRPLHNAGICSMRIGDLTGAENYFQRAFQVDPSNPVAMFNLAELNLKRGVLDRAKFYADRLIKTHTPSAETLWLALRVARKSGDRDSASSYGSQLRRQFPNSREAEALAQGRYDQ